LLLALCLIILGCLHLCGMANLCHEMHLFRVYWNSRYTPNTMGGVERKLEGIREEMAKSVLTARSQGGAGN
jgi:hypothetical protein